MNAVELSYTIRYTPKHGQRIAWAGKGIYKWNPDLDLWMKLSDGEWSEYAADETKRRKGLFLAFTEETTLKELR